MVTITNGVKTFHVTSGAVKVYEGMGFHVVSGEESDELMHMEEFDNEEEHEGHEERAEKAAGSDNVNSGMSKEDVAFIEEILEKPLSQWSNEEVKDFVKIKGIDTSGAQKVSQVRGIIKTYLEEQSKNM